MAQINFGLGSAQGRDKDQPSLELEQAEVFRQIVGTDHVHDHIDPLAVGKSAHLFDKIFIAVVDGKIGAQGCTSGAFVRAPRRDDNRVTAGFE